MNILNFNSKYNFLLKNIITKFFYPPNLYEYLRLICSWIFKVSIKNINIYLFIMEKVVEN